MSTIIVSPPERGSSLWDIVKTYLPLSLSAFGGPQAHVAMFIQEFVVKRQWIPEHIFTELFAIAQSLPGPASTQLAYSLAVVRGGPLAGVVAFLIWSVPIAVVMTGFAYGVAQLANGLPGWALHLQNGLTSSAVGLVALAAYKLSTKILVDPLLVLIASVCACLAILITNFPYLYPIMMIGGGAIEYVRQYIVSKRQEAQQTRVEANDLEKEQDDEISHYGFNYSVKAGLSMFGIWVILLVVSIVFRQTYVDRSASVFGTLYFVGSIIFGGGPVVVPLLQSYVVEAGWMTNPEFLIGLAIINVMPGPNFNIGAFCGALALRATSPVGGAVLGYLGIFLPGILLMSALLPLWKRFRQLKTVQAIFKGVNAAAVGLTFSAIYILAKKSIVATDGTFGLVFPITDSPLYTSVAAMTYASVGFANLPAPASIFIGGIVGVIEWALVK